jgi:hypothetical protein
MSKSLTSVKVDKEIYEQFKQLSSSKKFYLQDLVNKSLHLFVNDTNFRDQIYNHQISQLSPESQSVLTSVASEQT